MDRKLISGNISAKGVLAKTLKEFFLKICLGDQNGGD